MEQLLRLKYRGQAVASGEMDGYEVAEAIRGFCNFTRLIALEMYGGEAEIQTNVTGFDGRSFDVDFWIRVLAPENVSFAASMFGSPGDFLKLLGEGIGLIKHLEGEKPKSLKHVENEGVYVENNHGIVNFYDQRTVNIIQNPSAGRAARDFAGKPLEKSADKFEVIANDNVVASASSADVKAFVAVDGSDVLTEHVSQRHLTVQTVVLEGETKWKFSDGQTKFSAPIEDDSFKARIVAGVERFGRGDELIVRLRATQKRVNGKLKAEYVVERVLSHSPGNGAQKTIL